jgi:chromosome partitioning protein
MAAHGTQSIAFVHHKGGTGKTTACINVAGYLSKSDQRVLVVDLDPQGNATAGLGIDRRSIEGSLHDVLFGEQSMAEIILETESGVHVAPASNDLLAAEMHMMELKQPTGVLRRHLDSVAQHYDFILIDVPPGSTMLMINGIVAADALIVPIDAGIFGVETLETLDLLIQHIEDELGHRVPIAQVLLREYPSSLFGRDPTKKLYAMVETFLDTHHYHNVSITTIPYSRDVYASHVEGKPLARWRPHCAVGTAFARVAESLMHPTANGHTTHMEEAADAIS